jgi:hypothetical protein
MSRKSSKGCPVPPAGLAVGVALLLSACGGSSSSPQVPSLGGAAGTGSAGGRAARLHRVAECIRQHGVSSFPDPILTATGQVYFDMRSLQDASRGALDEAAHACAALAVQAGFNPNAEPPAPPQLVAAGVRASECLRAHGLSAMRDPNSSTPYVPGHGFSLSADEVPAGGKGDPLFQRAAQACSRQTDAEIQASTLASLGHD